jgi:DNA mismatch repair protein MSH5
VALPKNLVFNAENQAIIALPPDFSHIFNQDDESYFKNDDVDELDKNIGDPDGFIKDMEGMIVTELEEMILDTETELRETFNALSELDCLLSFAGCASDLEFVRPQVIDNTEGTRIYIKDGRHPLQEIVTRTTFVPNDTRIDDEDRVNVITGPNFSGKSCYARHVGVLVYMAHIGSFLPCTQAIISITDHIFARFDTVETCAVPQSSFQSNLTQMATILRRSTPHSLVLIDEFGKGTSPTSGISLLTAALKKLSSIGCKVVCTTHFLEIFSLNLLEDGKDGIKAKQMTVRLPESDDDGAAPLFKLRDGVASSSAGLICARAAGMNAQILNRAKEINLALREGRKVKPLKEALPPVPVLGSAEKAMLRCFFAVEKWETASDEQLRSLLQAVARA